MQILGIKKGLMQIKVGNSQQMAGDGDRTTYAKMQVCRRFTLIFTTVVRATCFVNS